MSDAAVGAACSNHAAKKQRTAFEKRERARVSVSVMDLYYCDSKCPLLLILDIIRIISYNW